MSKSDVEALIAGFHEFPSDPLDLAGKKEAFKRNMELVARLVELGEEATRAAIEEIYARHRDGSFFEPYIDRVALLLEVISRTATTEHAAGVAKMLYWKDLLIGGDGHLRATVLEILRRIGGEDEVPALMHFLEAVGKIDYPSFYGKDIDVSHYRDPDLEMVNETILACLENRSGCV